MSWDLYVVIAIIVVILGCISFGPNLDHWTFGRKK